jgi:hypothetical protein
MLSEDHKWMEIGIEMGAVQIVTGRLGYSEIKVKVVICSKL